MFYPGDKVSFINDKVNGTVVRMIDKRQALLKLDDGFEIPAYINELVLVAREGNKSDGAETRNEIILAEEADASDKIYFGAVAEDTGKGFLVKVYLINTRNSMALYALFNTSGGEARAQAHGEIEPSRAIKLYEYLLAEADNYKNLTLQLIFFPSLAAKPEAPVSYSFKVKPVALLKEQRNIPVLGRKGFMLNLTDRETGQGADAEKAGLSKTAKPEPVPDIVDLHLEELTETPGALLPHAALELQMKVFSSMLEKAIAQDMPSITFIHGVGQGRLKGEIRKILSFNPYIHNFADADHKKFGYGATIVFLKNR